MQHEGLLVATHGCCGCWKSYVHKKIWFMHHHLILKRIGEAAVTIRQQRGIFECTHQSLLHRRQRRRWLGCVMRWVPECVSIWSQLVANYNFFSEYFSGFAWFPTLVWPTSMIHGTARTYIRHKIALFWFPLLPHKVWAWSSPHSLFVKVQVLKPPMHLWTVSFYFCNKPVDGCILANTCNWLCLITRSCVWTEYIILLIILSWGCCISYSYSPVIQLWSTFGSAFANLCRVLKITPKIVNIKSAFLSGK